MKLVSLATVAVLFLALPAYDMSYMGPIKAKETKQVKIHLPSGRSTVEVWEPTDNGKLDCKFATSAYSGIEVEQDNTNKCIISFDVKDDTDYMVKISNLEVKDSNWRIWVHDTK